jgi:hypothetical protein
VVQARDLGDTFLVADSYGQGDLLGSKKVMYEFQAVTDLLELVDLVAWGMVFADPAASGSFGIEEMLQSLTCGHQRMICPYHPNCEPGKKLDQALRFVRALVAMTYH